MNAQPPPQRRSFRPIPALAAAVIMTGLACTPGIAGPAPPAADRDEYFRGRVVAIERTDVQEIAGNEHLMQLLRVRIRDRAGRERDIRAEHSVPLVLARDQALRQGEAVTVARTRGPSGPTYYIVDRYRLSSLLVIFGLFVLAVVWFSRTRGLTSVIGLGVSILVLARFVVPRILTGQNPLAVSLLGALAIASTSIYLAHGFSRRTSVALVGTLITLGIAAALAIAFVRVTGLTGLGSEEALTLQVGSLESLNLRGLLLGGIILGALGVLDDITTAQAAAVEEISRANPRLSVHDLYRRGLSVGQEHITALVNTLVLAYAGASLPLFLIFAIQIDQPLWVTLNSEFVAEEIVRSLVGSLALVFAVPITTWLAAQLLRAQDERGLPIEQGPHSNLHG
ncbi:MAG: YibE/F family protein [Armatimonadota bacterium]